MASQKRDEAKQILGNKYPIEIALKLKKVSLLQYTANFWICFSKQLPENRYQKWGL
jgi:hypothetical protein